MHNLIRHVCYFFYIAFFRFTPEDYRPYGFFFPWIRRKLVECFAISCGKSLRVKHNADVSPDITIGDYSELGQFSQIHSNVTIGSYVIMGPNVKIYSRNHIFIDLNRPIAVQGKTSHETVIGDDVWIGANVVILPGVRVGNHSIVGAGAIVTKNIPPFSIVGGNPACVIRMRR
jgi:maltose O-acetyltransferase